MPRPGLRSEAGSQAQAAGPQSPTGTVVPHNMTPRPIPLERVPTPTRMETAPVRGANDDNRSVRSGVTISSRVSRSSARARLEAAEAQVRIAARLQEIEQRRLQAESEVISRRLELQLVEAEEAEEQNVERGEEVTGRVKDWLRSMPADTARIPEDPLPTLPPQQVQPPQINPAGTETLQGYRAAELTTPARPSEAREPIRRTRFDSEVHYRERSTTPGDRRGRAIEQLAESIKSMAQNRPPPRQVYELPMFSGDSNEWLAYRAAYRESTSRYEIAPAENMARLRYSLRGQARDHVSSLLYAITNPDAIMRTLEQCYGRPEQIVDRAIDELRALPRLGPSASELNMFAVKVQNTAYLLSSIDDTGYAKDPRITKEVAAKLTPVLRRDWCHHAQSLRRVPDLTSLAEFLMREADCALKFLSADQVVNPRTINTKNIVKPQVKHSANRGKQKNTVATVLVSESVKPSTSRTSDVCQCCGGPQHAVPNCSKFMNLSINDRWQWTKANKMCFKCLTSKHNKRNCQAPACNIDNCKAWHHPLLHTSRTLTNDAANVSDENETASVNTTASDNRNVLLKIIKAIVSGPKGEMKILALVDEASTQTIIDADLAESLGLAGKAQPLTIRGVNTEHTDPDSRIVELVISGINREETFPIKARTMNDLQLRPQHVTQEEIEKCPHLKGIKSRDLAYEMERPRMLIGADNWPLIVTRQLCDSEKQPLAASKTRLGWVVHGKKAGPRLYENDYDDICHIYKTYNEDRLDEEVRKHFALDAIGIGIQEKKKPSDERAVQMFDKSVTQREDGRYAVGLPWREDNVKLPPSYSGAMLRLKSLEKKMDKNPDFRLKYHACIDNLIRKGYAEEASLQDIESDKAWYLPHFAVTNINKPGKIRLVFDAAAKTQDKCLNDELLDGPDLLTSLPGILWRFREGSVAVAADIEEMFLQIKIIPNDQPAQMFLWRGDDRNHSPNIYKMTSMVFGARSSPFLAHSVRNLNASKFKDRFPDACEASVKSHYMDDFIASSDSSNKMSQLAKDVAYVHKAANFNLRGWHSNSQEVLAAVQAEERRMTPRALGASSDCTTATLGLIWLPETDELAFNTAMRRVKADVREGRRAPTKREALSAVMSIYDPLGLLAHFTIGAKIILQKLWARKVDWDDPIPADAAQDFALWIAALEQLSEIKIPRWYLAGSKAKGTDWELHLFCDASEQAYAAVAYWRIPTYDNEAHVVLAAAKSKVAPLKPTTIPRMELQAALLGCRLSATLQKEHRIEPARVIYWSDSKTVIQWIKTDARKHHAFIAHRLGEIAEQTAVQQWRWLPSADNVADEATRLNLKQRIDSHDRWFKGPEFLRKPPESWSWENAPSDDADGANSTGATEYVTTTSEKTCEKRRDSLVPDITRFSNFNRLVRTTAYCLVFVNKLLKRQPEVITAGLLRNAEIMLVKYEQYQCFLKELLLLQNNKCVPCSSKLYRLDPVLDDEGVLRVRGRIDAASASPDARQPIILDGRRRFTRLLVAREHAAAGHASNERVVNELRQRYWVLRLRPTVRAVASACQRCRVRKARPAVPVAGDLPAVRLGAHLRPFTHCGVDYFGPMDVVVGRRREKRYGALFTCLATRAVHIEIAHSLTADSALMALRRMAARRGWPAVMMSDRGTNFIGANNQLAAAAAEWEPELRDFAASRGMEWRFNPAEAPSMGGAWERLVKSVKTALAAILDTAAPKDEVLHTLMAEAEYVVNSRPLTHVSVDARDPEALTPNHFLLGSSSNSPIIGNCVEANKNSWRYAQELANMFWRRWIKEYRPQILNRGESRKKVNPIAEGDIVVVVDAALPRNIWPMGRVERVITGRDGAIRSAYVKTKGGVFYRPVSKLAVLPVQDTVEAASLPLGGEDVEHS